ncbi:Nin one binding Zn-ribbon like-domain-containing protein [Cryomyces antarcticus]
MATPKPVHTLILDAGPIIKNDIALSTLIAQAEILVSTPAIISELRDSQTRARVETTLLPFLTLRIPNPENVKIIADFARRTGDLAVLSRPDLQILALAYELECERNHGDWRLRKVPGQKRLNGSPPVKQTENEVLPESETSAEAIKEQAQDAGTAESGESTLQPMSAEANEPVERSLGNGAPDVGVLQESEISTATTEGLAPSDVATPNTTACISEALAITRISQTTAEDLSPATAEEAVQGESEAPSIPGTVEPGSSSLDSMSGSDSEGWITPSNIRRHQAKDTNVSVSQTAEQKTIQVATITTDFAMQNVLLQMNLNLLSPTLQRVRHLKTFVLRCHACFQVTKEMSRQFCPRCGKPTLTRVACSTNQNGEFSLHLKKNMQWNTRGDRYSVPKPVAGSAHGRVKGGGKDGWGNELILAEDQKEYVRAMGTEKRRKERDLMDEDYLPSILTGARGKVGGRPKVGAGRNVNSRKR